MKKGNFVKLQNVGVGKVESIGDNYIVINICNTKYYRDLIEDSDFEPSSVDEYTQFLKFMIKELTEKSKSKRKQASEYNKSVDGLATKRKGKVNIINGMYASGLCENAISSYHRRLLQDAKQAKELKDKLKKELAFYNKLQKIRQLD